MPCGIEAPIEIGAYFACIVKDITRSVLVGISSFAFLKQFHASQAYVVNVSQVYEPLS